MSGTTRQLARLGFDMEAAAPRSCWPTRTQGLLLQACLEGPERARRAFGEWHGRVDVFKLDHGSNRMMGLLYRNLERAGLRAPEHEVLKGNWVHHWYQNKTRLREFAGVQRSFASAGMPVLVLKGLALGAFFYRDLGVRSMADFDLLVPPGRAREAMGLLRELGYRSPSPDPEAKIGKENGVSFFREGRTAFDLHWSVLHDCRAGWSDEAFWAGAETRTGEDLSALTLRAEDHVLHACAHGMRYNLLPPLRWLADTAAILGSEGEKLDLDYLMRGAERRRLADPLRRSLAWLREHLELPAGHPARVLRGRVTVSLYEKIEYPVRVYPTEGLPGAVFVWVEHRRRLLCGEPGAREEGFLGRYAAQKRLGGRVAAAWNAGVMVVKRVPPWLLRQYRAWRLELRTEGRP